MLTVVLKGDKRRPSGQGPGARLRNGLASQRSSASRAARAHRPSPPARAARSALTAEPGRKTAPQSGSDPRHTQPAARTEFSGQRDRRGDQA